MNPMQPLQTLLAHSERERDLALAEALRAAEAHRRALAQAEQLHDYRRDHDARFGAQAARGGGMEIVQCWQAFGARLDQAIDQQDRAVALAAQRSERAAAALQPLELRVASVRKLMERRGADERRADERRGQKLLDEQASRAAWNRLAQAGGTAGPGQPFGR